MRLKSEDSLLLLVDMQDKLFPHMEGKEELGEKVLTLVKGLEALEVPMLTARQYPQGLGQTLEMLQPYFTEYYDKVTFSCCGSEALVKKLQSFNRNNVIIAGIESHVCVLQTVLDIKAMGLIPVVVTDAVASRHKYDYEIALKRMAQEGALLTTMESILFELCYQAGTPVFKTISQLVK